MQFINFMPADFWPWILTAAGAVVAWVVAVFHGRRIERDKRKIKDLEDHVETSNRMAETPLNTDADAARERLRNRPKR